MSGLKIGDMVYWVNYYTEGQIECGKIKEFNGNDVIVKVFPAYHRGAILNQNRLYSSEIDAKINRCEHYITNHEYRIKALKNKISLYQKEKEELLIEKIAGI